MALHPRSSALVLALAAWASAAAAQEAEEPAPERARVAVLLLATGDLDPNVADELNELLIGGVAARGGSTILGRAELEAQLGESSLLSCIGSMPCIGRLGVQLGVSEVVAGTLAQRDGRWLFDLNRIDVRSGRVVGHAFREALGDLGAVADALSEALPTLYEEPEAPVRTGTLVLESPVRAEASIDGVSIGTVDGTLRHEGLAPGTHEVRVEAPDHEPWVRTVEVGAGAEVHLTAVMLAIESGTPVHPAVWAGIGIGVAALAVAIPLGLSSQAHADLSDEARRTMEITRADAVAFYEEREAEAIAADVLFAVAGVALAVGGAALFLPVFHAIDPPPRVRLGPGSIALEGSFR
jgi:hypothetical protein